MPNDFDDDLTSHIDEATIQQAFQTKFPSPILTGGSKLSKQEKITRIADHFHSIMEVLGLDLSDDSLKRTPYRIAKMYVEEVFSGLDPDTFPRISFIEDRFQKNGKPNMVFVKTSFCSFCEHHFVPMNGVAYIAYLPNKKLIGLSKIPRLVRFFARRPQVQERLTAQIADALSIVTGSEHVAVSICAQHDCMIARGVETEDSHAITNVLNGEFDINPTLRKEFFDALAQK